MNETQKKPFYKKWWFWVIIAVLVIGIGSSGVERGKTVSTDSGATEQADSSGAQQQAEAPAETVTEAPDVPEITVSAKDLIAAYSNNELKGDQLYKDKLAEITGTVSDVSVVLGSTYLLLDDDDIMTFEMVQCYFTDEAEINKLAEISKGSQITIVGRIDGKSVYVDVKECKIK